MEHLIGLLVQGLFELLAAYIFAPAPQEAQRGQERPASRASIHRVASPGSRSYREWEAIHRPPAPGALERRHVPEFDLRVGKGTQCLVCRDALETDLITCPKCATPHHAQCWDYNRGCSTYGCRGRMRRSRRS